MSDGAKQRRRRRVVRPSPAVDIDRSVDSAESWIDLKAPKESTSAADDERIVELDPEAEDAPSHEQFLAEEIPPHHGG